MKKFLWGKVVSAMFLLLLTCSNFDGGCFDGSSLHVPCIQMQPGIDCSDMMFQLAYIQADISFFGFLSSFPYGTRRERLKSALYLRLKKRKTFFLEKNLKFSKKIFFRKMSHSAEKCKRGDPF